MKCVVDITEGQRAQVQVRGGHRAGRIMRMSWGLAGSVRHRAGHGVLEGFRGAQEKASHVLGPPGDWCKQTFG